MYWKEDQKRPIGPKRPEYKITKATEWQRGRKVNKIIFRREGSRYQIEWKFQTAFDPPSPLIILENHIANWSHICKEV